MQEFLRALFDSNVYTALLVSGLKELHREVLRLKSLGKLRIYGLRTIREELKAAPKKLPGYDGNYVIDLLRLYDGIVGKSYEVDERADKLARAYFVAYQGCGGGIGGEKFANDLLIVACASLKHVDVVVSEDKSSLLNAYARRAYDVVNGATGLATSRLMSLKDFNCEIGRLAR